MPQESWGMAVGPVTVMPRSAAMAAVAKRPAAASKTITHIFRVRRMIPPVKIECILHWYQRALVDLF